MKLQIRSLCANFNRLLLLSFAFLFLISFVRPLAAQEVADTIRINTRVVFMDALVKDKKTGIPIADLKAENFEIVDDGKSRPISYFTREGEARKPLAIIMILDLRDDGAGRFLKRPEILKAMIDELSKLDPGDEVAILAVDINGEDETSVWLTDFTRDPAQIAAALSRVPQFIDVDPEDADQVAAREKERQAKESNQESAKAEPVKTEATPTESKHPELDALKPGAVMETQVIKGKNGAVVTRVTRKDGTVDVKRVSKDGKVTIELDGIYDMAAAVQEATRKAQQQRPNSQASIVWLSDGIAPMFFEDRDATQEYLIRSNVIFNSLTVELRTLFKVLMPIGKPIAGWAGMSIYGSAKRLAQQTGGEAIKVSRVKDYATGLNRIMGSLIARYSLGFAFPEEEVDDGRLHSLQLKVKALDAKGKQRKLQVSSRQGYYMTTAATKSSVAETAVK